MYRLSALSILAALAALGPHPARAETVNCTNITSLPATITTQGVYCLKQDLSTAVGTGSAITIATNNVTIDCNGYKIGGLAAGIGTQANGINAVNRMNASVRNCNVRGFAVGINLQGSGHLAEDNRLDGNTLVGIVAFGDGNVLRRNRIFDTGGAPGGFIPYMGIYASDSMDIEDNTISGVTATAGTNIWAAGIYTYGNLDGVIQRNRVRGVVGDGSGTSYGIWNSASGRVTVRDNQVVGSGTGTGLLCDSAQGHATANHLLGFTTGLSACHDGGANYTH